MYPRSRALLRGGSARQPLILTMPIFFLGLITTASGITLAKHDLVVFLGVVLTSFGVVAMWLAEKGNPRGTKLVGPGLFSVGAVSTGLAMTLTPSNPLLCVGMILSGLGIIGMWLVGRTDQLARGVAGAFSVGVILQGLAVTIMPSDVLLLAGMIFTGGSVFGMWLHKHREDIKHATHSSQQAAVAVAPDHAEASPSSAHETEQRAALGVAELEQRRSELERELNALQQRGAELAPRINELEAEVAALERRRDDARADYDALVGHAQDAVRTFESLAQGDLALPTEHNDADMPSANTPGIDSDGSSDAFKEAMDDDTPERTRA